MSSSTLEDILKTSQDLYRNIEPVRQPDSFTFNDLLNSISLYQHTHTPDQTQAVLSELKNINHELQSPGTSEQHLEALALLQDFVKDHLATGSGISSSLPQPPPLRQPPLSIGLHAVDPVVLATMALEAGDTNLQSLLSTKRSGKPMVWTPKPN